MYVVENRDTHTYTYIHIHMYISAHTIHTYMYASWVHSGARCVVKFSRRCILGRGDGYKVKSFYCTSRGEKRRKDR